MEDQELTEITRDDYHESVELIVDVIESEAGEYSRGEVHDLIHEEVDSSRWVMFTARNLKVLEYTDNPPQEWQHLVADGADYKDVLQAMAFRAMENDVYEQLRENGEVEL